MVAWILAVIVCQYVSPSVKCRYSVKTADYRIAQKHHMIAQGL